MVNEPIFDPLKSYTTAPGELGRRLWSVTLGAWIAWILNGEGAAVIAASQVCVATGTDRKNNKARLSSAGSQGQFAGIRPAGADSIEAGAYGAIIVAGPVAGVVIAGTDVTAADQNIIIGTAAGTVQKDAANVANGIGWSEGASAATLVTFNIKNGASVY